MWNKSRCWCSAIPVTCKVAARVNAYTEAEEVVRWNGEAEGTMRYRTHVTYKVGANARCPWRSGCHHRDVGDHDEERGAEGVGGECGEGGDGGREQAHHTQGTHEEANDEDPSHFGTCLVTDASRCTRACRALVNIHWRVTRCTGPIRMALKDGPVLGAFMLPIWHCFDGDGWGDASPWRPQGGAEAEWRRDELGGDGHRLRRRSHGGTVEREPWVGGAGMLHATVDSPAGPLDSPSSPYLVVASPDIHQYGRRHVCRCGCAFGPSGWALHADPEQRTSSAEEGQGRTPEEREASEGEDCASAVDDRACGCGEPRGPPGAIMKYDCGARWGTQTPNSSYRTDFSQTCGDGGCALGRRWDEGECIYLPVVIAVCHIAVLLIMKAISGVGGGAARGMCWIRGRARARRQAQWAESRRPPPEALRVGGRRIRRRRSTGPAWERRRARCRRMEAWATILMLLGLHIVHAQARDRPAIGGPPGGKQSRGGAGPGAVDEGPAHRCGGVYGYLHHDTVDGRNSSVGAAGTWWTTSTRVGEACNPGPTVVTMVVDNVLRKVYDTAKAAISYPRPGSGCLRGAVAPGFTNGGGHSLAPEQELFALRIETANTTGWRSLQRRLKATNAHAVLSQETWLTQDAIPAASAWARRHGWHSIWSAATPGPNGGGIWRSGNFRP